MSKSNTPFRLVTGTQYPSYLINTSSTPLRSDLPLLLVGWFVLASRNICHLLCVSWAYLHLSLNAESISSSTTMLSALRLIQDSGSFRTLYARCRTALPVNCLCNKRCVTSPMSCQEASISIDVRKCCSATICTSVARPSEAARRCNSVNILSP